MSSQSEKLFDAIGGVRDELVDEAARTEDLKRKKNPWLKYGGLAAVLALLVGLAPQFMPRVGKSEAPGAAEGGVGSDAASEFMSYDGPVFPLTLVEENENITAQRTLTLDFETWVPRWVSNAEQMEQAKGYGATQEELAGYAVDLERWYPEGGYYDEGTDLLVTDEYVLLNSADEDVTIEALYPYVADLVGYRTSTPVLLADGVEQETEVLVGGYAGGFADTEGKTGGERWNLDQPTSWQDYKALLADGSYLASAFSEGPDLSGEQVVVYQFTDPWGPERSDSIPNPSVRVSFELDYSKTTVLSYGFHSGSFEPGSGWMGRGFSIPRDAQWNKDHPKYLVMVGEDVENMQTTFYATGGWETDQQVEGGVTVERYETDLATALRDMAKLQFEGEFRTEYSSMTEDDFELYYTLMCDWLLTYGLLSDNAAERYQYGMVGDSDFATVDRVFYLKAQLTIPARGSVTLTAEQIKQASFDYACAGTENRGVSGYDAVTTLGSNLDFTAQHAKLEDRGQIAIVRQNFGFDLETGVTEVELDLDTEHYYLEVKRLPET